MFNQDDRPVCDFCDLMVEEGETLEPVFIGEPPETESHHLRATAERDGPNTTRVGHSEFAILGKPVGIHHAMYKAMRKCEQIEIKEYDNVREVRGVDGSVHFEDFDPRDSQGIVGDVSVEPMSTYQDNKVAVKITIDPKETNHSPDLLVCADCSSMLGEMRE